MDAIVTVDTAAAHLAGAMGHPSVHLVLPFLSDWRWHHTELWYPTIKTYRQRPPDDWTAPVRAAQRGAGIMTHHQVDLLDAASHPTHSGTRCTRVTWAIK